MSQEGVKQVATVFEMMQELRVELLDGDKQDIALAQILETGKDAMTDRFSDVVAGKLVPKQKPSKLKQSLMTPVKPRTIKQQPIAVLPKSVKLSKMLDVPADVLEMRNLVDELTDTIEDIDEETRDQNSEFFESVSKKSASILETIESTQSVSPGQRTALENMLSGVEKWRR